MSGQYEPPFDASSVRVQLGGKLRRGLLPAAVPAAQGHATPAPDYSYLCAGETTFHNYYGYVFGCLPPGLWTGK